MDFDFGEEQEALRGLAAQILTARATPERTAAVEAQALEGGDGIDRPLYGEIAAAGLVAAPLAEEFGGSGLGLIGACVVIEEVGRTAAAVPVLETLVMGALPIE